jgi:hypothetical protein
LKKVEMKIAAYIQLHTAYEYIHSKDSMLLLINKQLRNNEENHKRTTPKHDSSIRPSLRHPGTARKHPAQLTRHASSRGTLFHSHDYRLPTRLQNLARCHQEFPPYLRVLLFVLVAVFVVIIIDINTIETPSHLDLDPNPNTNATFSPKPLHLYRHPLAPKPNEHY